MTLLVADALADRSRVRSAGWASGVIVCLALAAGLAFSYGRAALVWHTGAFFDADDAMRIVQVRDLLAGQSWFDMAAHRFDPAAGGIVSHWSRIVDVPLAILIAGFGTALSPDSAERAARLAFPLLLQAALLLGLARLARLLVGPGAMALAIALGLWSGIATDQFQPGRVDHHAPQIVLLIASLGCLVAALGPGQARQARVAAALAALSLAISLETLPFTLGLVGTLVLLWVAQGRTRADVLRFYARGLLASLPVVFVATVAPSRWTLALPDAFSATHLVGGFGGALVLLALARGTDRLPTVARRLSAAVLGGAAALAATAILAPGGLAEPFVDLPPLVRTLWLANVREVWTLPHLVRADGVDALASVAPILLGAAGIALACWRAPRVTRERWLLVAMATAVGLALSVWAIRVLTFTAPLATLGGVWLVTVWQERLRAAGRTTLAALALCAALPFGQTGWQVAIAASTPDVDAPGEGAKAGACRAPDALRPLAALPPGLVLGPIDLGAHLLAFTPHAVIAAPYHRDGAGLRLSLETFRDTPDLARKKVVASGARYLVSCDDLPEQRNARAAAPDGLAAELAAGVTPAWLHPVPLATPTPVRVFAIDPTP